MGSIPITRSIQIQRLGRAPGVLRRLRLGSARSRTRTLGWPWLDGFDV
jgi:hypothetical protein